MKRGRDSSEYYMISVLSLMRHEAGRPRTLVRDCLLDEAPFRLCYDTEHTARMYARVMSWKNIVLHLPNIQSQRRGSYTNAYMVLPLIPAS